MADQAGNADTQDGKSQHERQGDGHQIINGSVQRSVRGYRNVMDIAQLGEKLNNIIALSLIRVIGNDLAGGGGRSGFCRIQAGKRFLDMIKTQ